MYASSSSSSSIHILSHRLSSRLALLLLLLLLLAFSAIINQQQVTAAPASPGRGRGRSRSGGGGGGGIDWSSGGVCGNPSGQTGVDFRSSVPAKRRKWRNRQELKQAMDRLHGELIHVRLNIVYDWALEEKHRNQPGGLQAFIRNLVYSLQLIYEQPELSSKLKFNFVVVSLLKTSIRVEAQQSANELLNMFSDSPEVRGENARRADLHALLVYRTMGTLPADPGHTVNPDPHLRSKVLGLAHMGTFCNEQRQVRTMVLSVHSMGAAPVFAHEMAHALNVMHDADPAGPLESQCQTDDFLMAPAAGEDNLTWSHCSVGKLLNWFSQAEMFRCVFDPARVASAQPLSDLFQLNPSTEAGSSNRRELPGELVPIDEQCGRYVDARARSALTEFGQQDEPFTTCQSMICFIGRAYSLAIGPAPPGSVCKNHGSTKLGRCSKARCLDEGTSR